MLGIPTVRAYREHLRRRATIRMLRNPDHPAWKCPSTLITDEMREESIPPTMTLESHRRSRGTTWKVHPEATVERAKEKGIGDEGRMTWQQWATRILESADLSEGRITVFTDGSILEDGRAGAGWAFSDGRGGGAALGKGKTSGDAEVEACMRAVEGITNPVLVLTDSTMAIEYLTQEGGYFPKRVAEARQDPRDIMIGWIKGYAGVTLNERADSTAKEAAESVDPDIAPMTFTLAWLTQEDTKKWAADMTEPHWGNGRVRTWGKAAARSLIRIRQATGPCTLCGEGETEGNNTRHVMLECGALEEARLRSGIQLIHGFENRREHPGWDAWLSAEEHRKTEKFVSAVARAWQQKKLYPREAKLEPYGDKVMREGG